MLILNAGTPRSGTVLTKLIIEGALGVLRVRPVITNPNDDVLEQTIVKARRSAQHRYRNILVHTHHWSRGVEDRIKGDPDVRLFVNYRDPRDVLVSLMRLHERDFTATSELVEIYFNRFAPLLDNDAACVVPYELLAAQRESWVFAIARHLGIALSQEQVAEIMAVTHIDRSREAMDRLNRGETENVAEVQNTQRVLREDRDTLINDRHIQSGRAGRWREELSAEEAEQATARFAPILSRFGFAS